MQQRRIQEARALHVPGSFPPHNHAAIRTEVNTGSRCDWLHVHQCKEVSTTALVKRMAAKEPLQPEKITKDKLKFCRKYKDWGNKRVV